MYVAEKYKAGFVHIPKTGGTSVIKSLFAKGELNLVGHKHGLLSMLNGPELYRDYFIFTMIRNPYSRLVSNYRFHKKTVFELDPDSIQFQKGMPKPEDGCWENLYNFLTHRINHYNMRTKAQYEFIRHSFLTTHICKFENLEIDVGQVAETIGVNFDSIKKDATVHYYGDYDYMDYLDKPSIRLINETCAVDFQEFGYKILY